MAGGAIVVLLGVAAPAGAQTGTVAVEEENFRSEPGGRILAELLEGTPLTLGETEGRWREATLEAWIWGRSVHEQQRPDLDLLVNAEGENLRATPNGDRVGRALGGMRLQGIETRGDWIRVRRTGWIWSASLESVEEEPTTVRSPDPLPDPPDSTTGRTKGEIAALSAEGVVLVSPGGDTLARVRSGAAVEVVAREGPWSRVRIEGWMFHADLSDSVGAVLTGLDPDSLLARPEEYRGRLVEWTVQFIAVQNAERFRTDFLEGEPFVLARGPEEASGFVYLAVPQELVGQVERLTPLQTIRVLGRIRSARSSLTGAPVLELLEIIAR